jgi:hypothetical protein
MQIEYEASQVTIGQLARLAQEMQTPAHAPTLPKAGSAVLGRLEPRDGRC